MSKPHTSLPKQDPRTRRPTSPWRLATPDPRRDTRPNANTGCVRAEHAFSGTSWTALTLEVGKSPTAVRWRAQLPTV